MRYTVDQKQNVLSRYIDNKETVAQLSVDTGIPRSTLYSWIKQGRTENDNPQQITRKKFRHLVDKVGRLEGIITILKTVHCTVHAPLQERLAACEQLYEQYSAIKGFYLTFLVFCGLLTGANGELCCEYLSRMFLNYFASLGTIIFPYYCLLRR